MMKPRVLIADRDVETGLILGWYLRESGFEVETASDGRDCLAKLRRLQPEVLVLDSELSRGDGGIVLDDLRDRATDRETSIVLIGDPGEVSAIHREAGPFADSLCKPFRLSALLESVRGAVDGRGSSQTGLDRAPDRPEFVLG